MSQDAALLVKHISVTVFAVTQAADHITEGSAFFFANQHTNNPVAFINRHCVHHDQLIGNWEYKGV